MNYTKQQIGKPATTAKGSNMANKKKTTVAKLHNWDWLPKGGEQGQNPINQQTKIIRRRIYQSTTIGVCCTATQIKL